MENKLLLAEFRSSKFQDKTTCLKTLDSFTETLEIPLNPFDHAEKYHVPGVFC